jgi:DNA-binding NarL/FixJ family response regulator
MPEQRIVLANTSRLLRDMLKRIIQKTSDLELLEEITDQRELPAVIANSHPEWVILSLPYDNEIPAWVDDYMVGHPSVRFMAIASDGSKIKVKRLEIHEQELDGISLHDLLHILQNKPSTP